MKSFLMLLITFVILVAVIGGGSALFYLAKTSEFNRVESAPPLSSPVR